MRRDHSLGPPTRQVSGSCVTVALVGRARHYRDCLVQVLRSRDEFIVVDAGSGDGLALERLAHLAPDVVLLDLPEAELCLFVRRARGALPEASLIALDVEEREAVLLALLEAGLTGFVLRDGSLEDVFLAIRDALRGELRCPPAIAAALARRLGESVRRAGAEDHRPILTTRELQVLGLVERGFTNKEIADRLSIELGTVKSHVHHVLHKFSVHHRREAAAHAMDGKPPLMLLRRGRGNEA